MNAGLVITVQDIRLPAQVFIQFLARSEPIIQIPVVLTLILNAWTVQKEKHAIAEVYLFILLLSHVSLDSIVQMLSQKHHVQLEVSALLILMSILFVMLENINLILINMSVYNALKVTIVKLLMLLHLVQKEIIVMQELTHQNHALRVTLCLLRELSLKQIVLFVQKDLNVLALDELIQLKHALLDIIAHLLQHLKLFALLVIIVQVEIQFQHHALLVNLLYLQTQVTLLIQIATHVRRTSIVLLEDQLRLIK